MLYGNLAENGCIVKTAAVAKEYYEFTGSARVFESQDAAVDAIMANDNIKRGDVVVIRYEGPRGGPGMQEMLYPTSYLKSKQLDKVCALVTDGRFSRGTSGLSIGHVSPEAANGGLIGLVEDGDKIVISIPERSIKLDVADDVLDERRTAMDKKGWETSRETGARCVESLESLCRFCNQCRSRCCARARLKRLHQVADFSALASVDKFFAKRMAAAHNLVPFFKSFGFILAVFRKILPRGNFAVG